MADNQELEPVGAVDQGVAEATNLEATGAETATRQPEKRVNLDELPEFRQYKSQMDRRIAQMERNYQAQLAQATQRQQQYEQSLIDGMEPEQRAGYEVQRERQLREAAEQRLYQLQVERDRQTALAGIAQEASELYELPIPLSALDQAESPDQAWRLATQYWKSQQSEKAKQSAEAQAQRQAKRDANRADTGAGKPPPASDDWETERQKHIKAGDTASLFKSALAWKT